MEMIIFLFQVPHIIVAFLLTFYSNVYIISANPVISSENQAMGYLQRYGYMDESISSLTPLINEEAFTMAIKEFQNFAGLDETGELDNETLTMMNTPRCGTRDMVEQNETVMSSYVLLGSKWRTKDLTYAISKYSNVLKDKKKVDTDIARAFKAWSDVTPLTFAVKDKGSVDINLRFVVRNHGDGDSFDGDGGILAHAVDPKYGGDVCFDDEERWTVNQRSGINLLQVAAHELGHSLGLGHSKVKTALMAPFYQGYQRNFKLHSDDIKGIQKLYGQSSKESPRTTSKPGSAPRPTQDTRGSADLCTDSAIDSVTRTEDGRTYVFKGDFYWRILKNGIDKGYPRRISTDWGGLPGNLDASLTWKNGRTFFFKGNQYWKFRNQKMERGYPKAISDGFKGIPNNVDAAFVWSRNSKTYFFKGDKYWRYDSEKEPPVGTEYPKSLNNWKGLPQNINAAFQWSDGNTYFFKNANYYRYNDKKLSVDEVDPPYPRSTSEWWFDCQHKYSIYEDYYEDINKASFEDYYEDLSKASLEEEDQEPVYIGNDHVTTTDETDDVVIAAVKQFISQYNGDPGWRDPNFYHPPFASRSSSNILSFTDIFISFIAALVVKVVRTRFM